MKHAILLKVDFLRKTRKLKFDEKKMQLINTFYVVEIKLICTKLEFQRIFSTSNKQQYMLWIFLQTANKLEKMNKQTEK